MPANKGWKKVMSMNKKLNQHYGDYLQLESILNAQMPISRTLGEEKHDEMLFIIVHQAHELWFKQIHHEIDSIIDIFSKDQIGDNELLTLSRRLHRIHVIQKILLDQLTALNTLSPMEFLEFRDNLIPASGFQSLQFRLLEIKLGIKKKQLLHCLAKEEQQSIKVAESNTNLLTALCKWLERTPFLKTEDFTFWRAYRENVSQMLENDRQKILNTDLLQAEEQAIRLREIESMQQRFNTFFNRDAYQQLLNEQQRRMSFQASQAALFIFLYRDQPALQVPYQILSYLIQIDDNLTSWRSKHLLLVQRIIGAKMGTGGSSGAGYLSQGLKNQAFGDLTSLSTFMLPSSALPTLPSDLEKKLSFYYQSEGSHHEIA